MNLELNISQVAAPDNKNSLMDWKMDAYSGNRYRTQPTPLVAINFKAKPLSFFITILRKCKDA